MESIKGDLTSYANLRNQIAPNVPLILEETATQAGITVVETGCLLLFTCCFPGGGCEGLSDRFVSGFWCVHTL